MELLKLFGREIYKITRLRDVIDSEVYYMRRFFEKELAERNEIINIKEDNLHIKEDILHIMDEIICLKEKDILKKDEEIYYLKLILKENGIDYCT